MHRKFMVQRKLIHDTLFFYVPTSIFDNLINLLIFIHIGTVKPRNHNASLSVNNFSKIKIFSLYPVKTQLVNRYCT